MFAVHAQSPRETPVVCVAASQNSTRFTVLQGRIRARECLEVRLYFKD